MSQDIPMASNLLKSKIGGYEVRKLAESVGPPMLPCVILYTLGLPLQVTLPLLLVGVCTGVFVYRRTPAGQRPLNFMKAILRDLRDPEEFIWQAPTPEQGSLGHGDTSDQWLTPDEYSAQEAGRASHEESNVSDFDSPSAVESKETR